MRNLLSKIFSTSRTSTLHAFVAVSLSLLLGFAVFFAFADKGCPEDPDKKCSLDWEDALYLTIVTISTVGYGDLSPSTGGLRIFTVLYILFGCAYTFVQLANVFAIALERFADFVKHFIDRFDRTASSIDTSGDGLADTSVSGRSMGLSGRSLEYVSSRLCLGP